MVHIAYCICKIYSWNLFISLVANAPFACINTFPSPFIVLTETLNWIHSRKTIDWKWHKLHLTVWILGERISNIFDHLEHWIETVSIPSIYIQTSHYFFSIFKLNQHKNEIQLQIEFSKISCSNWQIYCYDEFSEMKNSIRSTE